MAKQFFILQIRDFQTAWQRKIVVQLTKKIVINNFRENDIRNETRTPLTPIFHKLLSKDKSKL